ncbi:hypothetical protein Tco_0661181, partial [Tanacetum coccineum]
MLALKLQVVSSLAIDHSGSRVLSGSYDYIVHPQAGGSDANSENVGVHASTYVLFIWFKSSIYTYRNHSSPGPYKSGK